MGKNSSPIQWASVAWNASSGLVTNEMGLVEIPSVNEIADTVLITNIGYKTIHFPKNKILANTVNTIMLDEEFVELPPVIAGKKWTEKEYGCKKKRKGMCVILNPKNKSYERGIRISGTPKGSIIKDCSVFISKRSVGTLPFRIKIYSTKSNGFPSETFLNESIVVSNYELGKWNKIDLSTKNITLPGNSFFVGVEWLTTSNNDNQLVLGADNWTKEKIEYSRIGNLGFGMLFSKYCIPMIRVTLLN